MGYKKVEEGVLELKMCVVGPGEGQGGNWHIFLVDAGSDPHLWSGGQHRHPFI